MTVVRVGPGPVSGRVEAPASKSYTHRALVVAHLSHRTYRIDRPLRSDDTLATVGALLRLGDQVSLQPDRWTVTPGEAPVRSAITVDCGESGTTLRFASALASLGHRPVRLVGHGRLPERPMAPLSEALRSLGATITGPAGQRALPMVVRGPVHGGRVRLDASASSQFVSALLFALPTVRPDSTVRLSTDPVSVPYIDATLAVLRASGVQVDRTGRRFEIPGGQTYGGRRFRVPGDASSAAYLWAAAALAGGSVTVRGIPAAWPQADLAVIDLLERYGAIVRRRVGAVTVAGDRRVPFRVSLTDSPDLFPLAGVLAAAAPGRSRIEGAPQVATKESDRRTGTARLARAMGATVRATATALVIDGTASPRSFALRGNRDHRLVMSAAVGALAGSRPSAIADAEAVRKSFPGFWTELAAIAGRERVR